MIAAALLAAAVLLPQVPPPVGDVATLPHIIWAVPTFVSEPLDRMLFIPYRVPPTRKVAHVVGKPVLKQVFHRTKPTPKPSSGHYYVGTATWYCLPGVSRCSRGFPASGYYAAIKRPLLGHRGQRARVCLVSSPGRCVTVRVIDCNCGPSPNLIDMYASALKVLVGTGRDGRPRRGGATVRLTWL